LLLLLLSLPSVDLCFVCVFCVLSFRALHQNVFSIKIYDNDANINISGRNSRRNLKCRMPPTATTNTTKTFGTKVATDNKI